MTTTRTARGTRHVLAIAAGLALAVVPAAAAVHSQDSALAADGGSLMADATITPAPPVAGTTSPALADIDAAQPLAESTGRDGEATSDEGATAAQVAAVSVPSDESGSTEARTVQRSCGAAANPHYVPSKGSDSKQCYDSKGKFQSSRTYTATHYTNNVACGGDNKLPWVSGTGTSWHGTAGADGGYVGFCAEDTVPVHGRATARADADGSAEVVWDGDKDNPEETTQGWASATVSAAGPEYRCGKSYAEGGRGTADAPTSTDNADQCAP